MQKKIIKIMYFNSKNFGLKSKSEENTIKFASFFLNHFLKENSVVFLIGSLGTGKTTFVKGLSKIFDIESQKIVSPSFNIIKKYQDKNKIRTFYHIDLYRIEEEKDLEELHLEELLLQKNSFVFIEWANKFLDSLNSFFVSYPIWNIYFNLLNNEKIGIKVKLLKKINV